MCEKTHPSDLFYIFINRQNIPKYLLQKQQLYDIITPTVSMPSIRLGVYALVAHIHSGVAEFLPQQCCRRCFYVRTD